MPRRKGNKQTTPSHAISVNSSTIHAKCTGCQVNGDLTGCEFCQYPECTRCIEKHRQADKLSRAKASVQARTDSLRPQLRCKYETLHESIEKMTVSLDLLAATKEMFDRSLQTEYDTYEQKLKQSQAAHQKHINDLNKMWAEFEKMSTTDIDDYTQIDLMISKIEASLTKQHMQLCFQPSAPSPILGYLDERLSDSVMPYVTESKEQVPNVPPSTLSSGSSVAQLACHAGASSSRLPFTDRNQSECVNGSSATLELALVLKGQQQQELAKLHLGQEHRQADESIEPQVPIALTTSAEPKRTAETTTAKPTTALNFNRLKQGPKTSLNVIGGQRMASNNDYLLVCPEGELSFLDSLGSEHMRLKRNFDVSDICWSTYLKRFLILTDEDLYSLDLTRPTPLMIEISEFGDDMDEFTCYDNICVAISDSGGAEMEVWDMEMNWKSIKRYGQPISCEHGQGVCSIRFNSSGTRLGVTLIDLRITKAYFQLRSWHDMRVLQRVEQPFYEGYCNHYMLALPNDEFLVYKYSKTKIFLFRSDGQQKQMIQYPRGVSSAALLLNDKKCLVVQTSQPDQLHFYDI